eukprot:10478140-Prorocentrum_lima.AAC.1
MGCGRAWKGPVAWVADVHGKVCPPSMESNGNASHMKAWKTSPNVQTSPRHRRLWPGGGA